MKTKISKNHKIFNTDTFDSIIDLNNLKLAFYKTQRSKSKYKKDSILFSIDLFSNLNKIQEELINKNYLPGEYNTFTIYEPKERIISAPKFKDKVVQFAIHNILDKKFNEKFINDSYACILKKGTHKSAHKIQRYLKKAKINYDNPYIIKMDIKKFFYSIDRNILKNILKKHIYCKDTLDLLFKIIDKSPDTIGLPLGNCTSQLFANIYLNELDQYIKRKLGVKYYVRYMDDMMLLVDDKIKAKEVLKKLIYFLKFKLNLKINEKKTKIFPLKQGINIVGYKIYLYHMKLRDSSKRNIKRKIKKMKNLIYEKRMTKEKAEQIISSWMGHAKHGNSKNFIKSLIERYNYLELNKKGKIIIKINNKIKI